MTHNKITCIFGYHDYSRKRTMDKDGRLMHLCKHCKRSGYEKWHTFVEGSKVYDYDEKGNLTHKRWSDGWEVWYKYDKEGNLIHVMYPDGSERWKGNDGHWVKEKPKNWKYEKAL